MKHLETQGLPLQGSMVIMKNASENLSTVKGEADENVSTKLQAVLKRSPGFSTFTSVCQILNGDDVTPPDDIILEKIPLSKYAPVTSCDAEGSFSAYKHILSVKRQPMTPENM
jgi:hypothetical protein